MLAIPDSHFQAYMIGISTTLDWRMCLGFFFKVLSLFQPNPTNPDKTHDVV
jgi:hypothetical protein